MFGVFLDFVILSYVNTIAIDFYTISIDFYALKCLIYIYFVKFLCQRFECSKNFNYFLCIYLGERRVH